MKKPFEVGERVRFYDSTQRYESEIIDMTESTIQVMTAGNQLIWIYPQQARRLIKKVRREWWIRECVAGKGHGWSLMIAPEKECELCEIIRVREVKEKK